VVDGGAADLLMVGEELDAQPGNIRTAPWQRGFDTQGQTPSAELVAARGIRILDASEAAGEGAVTWRA
jgi:hypothetical protein